MIRGTSEECGFMKVTIGIWSEEQTRQARLNNGEDAVVPMEERTKVEAKINVNAVHSYFPDDIDYPNTTMVDFGHCGRLVYMPYEEFDKEFRRVMACHLMAKRFDKTEE